ncbi:MAG: DUF502 domain-containing protein [Pseudomonadota bacterium]
MKTKKQSSGFLAGLRNNFLAGVVVAAPVGITAAIVYWFVTGPMAQLDVFVKRWLPAGFITDESLIRTLPGVGVLIAIVFLILLGALAKNFLGRTFIGFGERFVDATPVVRNVYRFFKNVFETALQQSDQSFKEIALIEYPRPGVWAVAFVVTETKGEVKHIINDEREGRRGAALLEQSSDPAVTIAGPDDDRLVSVFIPTTPNPTSGFLLFLPRKDVRVLDMSVEEGAKLIFSAGLVTPEFNGNKTPEEMAAELEAEGKRSLRSRLFGTKKDA